VNFEVSGNMAIYGSSANNNGNGGLVVNNASASAYVQEPSFDNNASFGVVGLTLCS